MSSGLMRRLLVAILLGAAVFAALALLADGPKVAQALAAFDWRMLPVAVALTLWNYALRWAKWHAFLRVVGVRVPVGESAWVFVCGLGMAITPGKVGELLKAYLLRGSRGVPASVTAPIVVAERLTDGLAMVLLALGGLASVQDGAQALAAFLLPALGLVALVRWRRGAEWVLRQAGRLPLVARQAGQARAFYESTYHLLGVRSLVVTVLLSLVSWFGEAVALFVLLLGLGHEPSVALLLQATFAMALATLLGTFSMLPGGLGLAEASLTGLLMLYVPAMTLQLAAAGTMLFRLVTFWLAIALGLGALALYLRRGQPAAGASRAALAGSRVAPAED
jgi:uncharacterized protein (TIRG00374 family)